jgi:predicted acetyltransferase
MSTRLITPTLDQLPAYVDALERGWSPDNIRGALAALEILERIRAHAALYVERETDVEARGGPVTLPDGSTMARIPGRAFWIVDGDPDSPDFCGSINLRWQHGTADLPPHYLGHVGYAVVPWKRRRGHASAALRALLPHARSLGLPWIDVSTAPDNIGSRRVIEAAGGALVEHFETPAAYGCIAGVRYRITLEAP